MAVVISAVVMIPANLPAPPVKGRRLMSSSVAVAERRIKGAVPPVAVKMFWAEVAREVAVATPRAGVVKEGEVPKTRAPLPVSSEMTPSNWADVVAANTERLLAVYATVPPPPKATDEASVPVKVRVLLAVKVLPSAIVRVAAVAGAVMVTLLTVVAVATPMLGVVRVGLVAKTRRPEPVSSSIKAKSSEEASISVSRRTLPVVAPEVSKATLPVTSGKV